MLIRSISLPHPAREIALRGLTSYSMDMLGVGGDNLDTEKCRIRVYDASNNKTLGYVEGKFFWGVYWINELWAEDSSVIITLLKQIAQTILGSGVDRLVIITSRDSVRTQLEMFNIRVSFERTTHTFPEKGYQYLFEISCAYIFSLTSQTSYPVELLDMSLPLKSTVYAWIAQNSDDNVLGYIELGVLQNWGHVRLIYTHPEYRKCGIGSALMDVLIKQVKHLKCCILTVETLSHQAPEFYMKHAFNQVFSLKKLRAMSVKTLSIKQAQEIQFLFLERKF